MRDLRIAARRRAGWRLRFALFVAMSLFVGSSASAQDFTPNTTSTLTMFYHATGGPNWTNNTNWLSNEPFSTWYGVATDTAGRVTHLRLWSNGLTGRIPTGLTALTLTHLWLNDNDLAGQIPSDLGGLANLGHLSLDANRRLQGPVPPSFANLSSLWTLRLAQTALSGPLPQGLTRLRNLSYLDIRESSLCAPDNDAFRTWVQSVADFFGEYCVPPERAALEALYHATGGPSWTDNTNWLSNAPVGEWFGVTTDASGRVTALDLPGNGLSGPIPVELGALTNLVRLALWDNQLSGPIPPQLGNLTNLTDLALWGNRLSGPILPQLGSLTNLTDLALGDNELSGPVPDSLGGLANLEQLYLSSNELSGPIPSSLGNLADLRYLGLGDNELSGPVPDSLGGLANLEQLYLSSNELSGPIPSSLGNLADLRYLGLGDNELSGPVPDSLGGLANLEQLYLSSNELSGPIPSSLGNLADLRYLGLGDNELSGPVPDSLGGLANLEQLYLEHNELSGPIPGSLGNLANLGELDLSNNQLTGLFPVELVTMAGLYRLDLSHNRLSGFPASSSVGTLVQWLARHGRHGLSQWIQAMLGNLVDFGSVRLAALRSLDLSYNPFLTGSISAASFLNLAVLIEKIPNVESLDLSTTGLIGELPLSVMNLSKLNSLRIENTGMCAPGDAGFQAWVASIHFSGVTCGPNPVTFTDHPLRPATPLKAVHFDELRIRIAALRARERLPEVQWTDATLTPGVTPVKRVHLTELRAALDAVYDVVRTARPAYTDAEVAVLLTLIKAAHVMELRAAIAALE